MSKLILNRCVDIQPIFLYICYLLLIIHPLYVESFKLKDGKDSRLTCAEMLDECKLNTTCIRAFKGAKKHCKDNSDAECIGDRLKCKRHLDMLKSDEFWGQNTCHCEIGSHVTQKTYKKCTMPHNLVYSHPCGDVLPPIISSTKRTTTTSKVSPSTIEQVVFSSEKVQTTTKGGSGDVAMTSSIDVSHELEIDYLLRETIQDYHEEIPNKVQNDVSTKLLVITIPKLESASTVELTTGAKPTLATQYENQAQSSKIIKIICIVGAGALCIFLVGGYLFYRRRLALKRKLEGEYLAGKSAEKETSHEIRTSLF